MLDINQQVRPQFMNQFYNQVLAQSNKHLSPSVFETIRTQCFERNPKAYVQVFWQMIRTAKEPANMIHR